MKRRSLTTGGRMPRERKSVGKTGSARSGALCGMDSSPASVDLHACPRRSRKFPFKNAESVEQVWCAEQFPALGTGLNVRKCARNDSARKHRIPCPLGKSID